MSRLSFLKISNAEGTHMQLQKNPQIVNLKSGETVYIFLKTLQINNLDTFFVKSRVFGYLMFMGGIIPEHVNITIKKENNTILFCF